MSQSRLSSFIEAWINVAIGFGVSFCANLLILPMFGYTPSISENLLIGFFYTIVSVIRSYCVRRWFNAQIRRAAERMAGDAA